MEDMEAQADKQEVNNSVDIREIRRLKDYAIYMQGAMNALMKARECFMPYIKGENAVYAKAEFDLYINSTRNIEHFLMGDRIGYRAFEQKGNRLVKCEAYFL